MNNYDKIEEKIIKKEQKQKKKMKISGRSIFNLKKIIGKKTKNVNK